jgi:DNA-binding NarL/FixJ family response regulator
MIGRNHAASATGRHHHDSGLPSSEHADDDSLAAPGDGWLTAAAASVYAALSPKEQAVLLAAARGAEDKEIAAKLGCTISTVRTLWQRTYKKTHTASRRRLVAAIWEKACQLAALSFLERHDRLRGFSEGSAPRDVLE